MESETQTGNDCANDDRQPRQESEVLLRRTPSEYRPEGEPPGRGESCSREGTGGEPGSPSEDPVLHDVDRMGKVAVPAPPGDRVGLEEQEDDDHPERRAGCTRTSVSRSRGIEHRPVASSVTGVPGGSWRFRRCHGDLEAGGVGQVREGRHVASSDGDERKQQGVRAVVAGPLSFPGDGPAMKRPPASLRSSCRSLPLRPFFREGGT